MDERFGNKLNFISIISNGSRNDSFYEKLSGVARNCNINLIISLHLEFANIEHICSLIEKLSENISLRIDVMFHPELFSETKKAVETLIKYREKYAFDMTISTIRQGPHFDVIDERYTSDEFKWQKDMLKNISDISRSSEKKYIWREREKFTYCYDVIEDGKAHTMTRLNFDEYLKEGLNSFTGMKCVMGTSLIHIKPDGTVSGAVCPPGRTKINIFHENPFLDESYVKIVECPMKNCGCQPNLRIPKFSSSVEAERFRRCFINRQKQCFKSE